VYIGRERKRTKRYIVRRKINSNNNQSDDEHKREKKAVEDAKFTGARTEQQTHTHTRNKVSKQKYIHNQNKQTHTDRFIMMVKNYTHLEARHSVSVVPDV
jgi:hypothetical protein